MAQASWGQWGDSLRVRWGNVQFLIDDQGIAIGGDLTGVDPGDWAVRVALGFAVQRESRVAFHGSAVEKAGRAIVILGNKGAGKSTTALGLTRRGWAPLADDSAVVSEDGSVWPGSCHFRLCTDVQALLSLTSRSPDSEGKYTFVPRSRGGAAPLGAIVILGIGTDPRVLARPISGYRKAQALFPHLHSPEGVGDPQLRQSRLLTLAKLPVFEILRPAHRLALEEVLDTVESLVRSPQ